MITKRQETVVSIVMLALYTDRFRAGELGHRDGTQAHPPEPPWTENVTHFYVTRGTSPRLRGCAARDRSPKHRMGHTAQHGFPKERKKHEKTNSLPSNVFHGRKFVCPQKRNERERLPSRTGTRSNP